MDDETQRGSTAGVGKTDSLVDPEHLHQAVAKELRRVLVSRFQQGIGGKLLDQR